MSQRGGYIGELVVAQSYENLDDSIDVAVAAGDCDGNDDVYRFQSLDQGWTITFIHGLY